MTLNDLIDCSLPSSTFCDPPVRGVDDKPRPPVVSFDPAPRLGMQQTCGCGATPRPGYSICRSCLARRVREAAARAKTSQRHKRRAELRRPTCAGCARYAKPGEFVCGRRLCRGMA